MQLSGESEQKLARRDTESNEAYQLYLKGRFHLNQRTTESLKQAVVFYRQAIEKDPNFALAWSGLAATYAIFPIWSVGPPKDSMPQAKAAALRALELDDSLAEAHAALGLYLHYYEFDRAGAEKEMRRAIQLNPNYATAHEWLAVDILTSLKRFDEAVAEIKRAALGEKEEALMLLEKDLAERSSFVSYSAGEPALDDLRDDPRFKALLKRMNLPE